MCSIFFAPSLSFFSAPLSTDGIIPDLGFYCGGYLTGFTIFLDGIDGIYADIYHHEGAKSMKFFATEDTEKYEGFWGFPVFYCVFMGGGYNFSQVLRC